MLARLPALSAAWAPEGPGQSLSDGLVVESEAAGEHTPGTGVGLWQRRWEAGNGRSGAGKGAIDSHDRQIAPRSAHPPAPFNAGIGVNRQFVKTLLIEV